ncbi:DUF4062 domain-containing protein [Pseudomonas sp. UV AK001]|uniref:DUF4062 domain-containing protein n=1 Tax=Pseudomonas sp. UV AK001 TaxID=3384791 RepID=UPI0038D4F368
MIRVHNLSQNGLPGALRNAWELVKIQPKNQGFQALSSVNLSPPSEQLRTTVANQLRAFISSTMEDLGNERRAVVSQLKSMGIEPVNAEDMPPDGRSSWETIHTEIEQCHLFILILGDRYGWEPDSGVGAGSGLSVTHLEFLAARRSNKLVLPFMKKLRFGAAQDTKRDEFRKEVSSWTDGLFRQEFEWANDLAIAVGKSVTSLFADALHKELFRRRNTIPAPVVTVSCAGTSIATVNNGKVLLAGAGMSVAAGYPTALVLMEILASDLWSEPQDATQLMAYNFSVLASYYEKVFGRSALELRITQVLDTPQTIQPTPAHLKAVRVFRNIITTNYDRLFEKACELQGVIYRVVHPSDAASDEQFEGLTIYKMVGSALVPGTLVLTSDDLPYAAKQQVFTKLQNLIEHNELVVIGHSLRDGNVQQLLGQRDPHREGVYVSPSTAAIDELALFRFGLKRVQSTADDFMNSFLV